MSNLENIIYLSREQYKQLIKNGSITIDGVTVQYNDNDIHIVPLDENTYNEQEKEVFCDLIGAASIQYVDKKLEDFKPSGSVGGAVSGLGGLYEHRITIHGIDENGNEGDFIISFLDYSETPYTDYDEYYTFQGLEMAISKCINPLIIDEELTFLGCQYLRVVDFFVDQAGNYTGEFTDIYGETHRFIDMVRVEYEIKGE